MQLLHAAELILAIGGHEYELDVATHLAVIAIFS